MVATRTRNAAAPAPAEAPPSRAASEETVSLSLEGIVEELANHVEPEKRPQVELLRRLAREKPDQHAKVKEQMLLVGGPEALRAAVSSLVSKQKKEAAAAPKQPPPPPPPACPTHDAPLMPPNLPQIFGSSASTPAELKQFHDELLHAFHCRSPSCPVSGCKDFSAKLQRLRLHISSCNENSCLLCSIWSYLSNYNAAMAAGEAARAAAAGAPGGSLMFRDELLGSRALLPCYENGQLQWLSPPDALASINQISAPAAKRARGETLTAIGAYNDSLQRPLMGGLGGFNPAASAVPRLATANAPAAAAAGPAGGSSLPLPYGMDFLGRGSKRSAGMAGFDPTPAPLARNNSFGLSAALGLEKTRSMNLSGALNMLSSTDLAKCASLTDLGLAFSPSMTDLSQVMLSPNLSLSKNSSELKEVNASSLSVTGLLDMMGDAPGTPKIPTTPRAVDAM